MLQSRCSTVRQSRWFAEGRRRHTHTLYGQSEPLCRPHFRSFLVVRHLHESKQNKKRCFLYADGWFWKDNKWKRSHTRFSMAKGMHDQFWKLGENTRKQQWATGSPKRKANKLIKHHDRNLITRIATTTDTYSVQFSTGQECKNRH